MPEKELGFYTSDREDSFKVVVPEIENPKAKITFTRPEGLKAEEWFNEAERRQETRAESEDVYDYAKIEFKSDRPVCIGFTGDWHLGATIDTEMLKRDVDLIANHPLVAGAFFMGDLTDSANFNPAEDESYLSLEEQRAWMLSILDFIGKDRILAMWKGNHDHKWERKNGVSKYAGLSKKYDAPVFYGGAYIDLNVNDINYKLMGSHRLRGSSIYNNAHAAVRGHREVQGLDLTFAGHVHRKGHIEQPVREFNDSRTAYGLINGTYQLGSEYTKDSGYGVQRGAELGMYWVLFGHDKKMLRVMDTDQMIETMANYM
jgi:hypothetical protein